MDKADEFRKRAEECLLEAETAPASLRLQLITIAQRWFELAEAAKHIAPDSKGHGGDESE